ncbi:MAG: cob(I)yrinic acid a,c-diamide adenosyltransferase [Candidatus Micrarchaeia archaeon]
MKYLKKDTPSPGIFCIYTGNGKGKTTAALGLALRAAGHGQKVIMVQFMKKRDYVGEFRAAPRLAPNFEIHRFGREEFVDPTNPEQIDRQLAAECLEFAKNSIKREPDILIIDEMNGAISMGLVKLADAIALVKSKPKETSLVFTGRDAPAQLLELADIATEMKELKHHYNKGFGARLGFDY